ncbi:hypothetical protein [Noviherbaspirillum saxi]|nr:hypothetical protein [Noviherbaspirillum saxi]
MNTMKSAPIACTLSAIDFKERLQCCSFLQFQIDRTSIHIELTIIAQTEAENDAWALFAHLTLR